MLLKYPLPKSYDFRTKLFACSLMSASTIQEAFRPTGDGNLASFKAARSAGASRFVMISSLNPAACRDQFEVCLTNRRRTDRC